jgi:hypothetical protein
VAPMVAACRPICSAFRPLEELSGVWGGLPEPRAGAAVLAAVKGKGLRPALHVNDPAVMRNIFDCK